MEEQYTVKVPSPFLQRHSEEWDAAYIPLIQGDAVGVSVKQGAILKAGISLGWVEGVSINEIPGLEAWVVVELSAQLFEGVTRGRMRPKKA